MQKILIVDDQQDILRLLSRRLEINGFTTIGTTKGTECFELALLHKPDAILLDIMMPDANGLDLCRMIRNNSETNHIPILLVSGRILPQDVRAGFDAGASDYIKKPFEQIELIERVRQAIKQEQDRSRQVEDETNKTYLATVVAANHKVKQPLTLINLAVTSIKRMLARDAFDKASIEQKLEIINGAVTQIAGILDSLSKISKPEFEEYVRDITMINLDQNKNTIEKKD
jgi:two-component system cell cycle response regulator